MYSHHDDFFKQHRPSPVARVGFALWFIFCAIVTLAMLGLTAWAIIALVQWVTTK